MSSGRVSSGAVLVIGLAVVSLPMAATAKSITVRPGGSIQQAVNDAAPGDTVKVLSGDYCATNPRVVSPDPNHSHYFSVLITKPLTLMASGQVRILADCASPSLRDGDSYNGIGVRGTTQNHVVGVEIKGFTVEAFPNNGIWLEYVDNFNIENNVSADNGENGIWPTLSANGQVKNNVAYGALDSALWVEASENVRVFNNDLSGSPTGLEVTLSKDLSIENNNVHGNTVGIGLYHPSAAGLPKEQWPTYQYGNWRVVNNYVHDNNAPNEAEEGGEVALLPPGLGMLILGVDHVDVMQNRVEQNDFVGVAMIDWCVAVPTCEAELIDIVTKTGRLEWANTAVDSVHVVANKFAGNHTTASPPPPFGDLASDILFIDGSYFGLTAGTGNCQSDNKLIKTPNPQAGASIVVVPDPALFPTC